MKFAPNRMYIERYNKCPNCGILLYEKPANSGSETVMSNGKIYCSEWCVKWEEDRKARYAAEA
jgi:hypothetical protein